MSRFSPAIGIQHSESCAFRVAVVMFLGFSPAILTFPAKSDPPSFPILIECNVQSLAFDVQVAKLGLLI